MFESDQGLHQQRRVLIRAERKNRLYVMKIKLSSPICLFTDMQYSGLCLMTVDEPGSVEEAMKEACWREAMQNEMQSIEENRTWESVELPAKQRAIGLKWVFKVKKNPEGKIVNYKARLVAKGYAQQQGVDYEEVFAPIARIETVRVMMALAAQGGWQVHHMDVKSAFLNGYPSMEICQRQCLCSDHLVL